METYEFMKVMGERSNKVNQFYACWAKSRGIGYHTLAVFYVVYKNGACSQKRIATEWSLPKQTVNTTCMELLAKGLITQAKSEEDKREARIRLTEQGRALAAPIVEELLTVESKVLAQMGEETTRLFLDLFNGYCDAMEAELKASMRGAAER